jgi:hypothetical protein
MSIAFRPGQVLKGGCAVSRPDHNAVPVLALENRPFPPGALRAAWDVAWAWPIKGAGDEIDAVGTRADAIAAALGRQGGLQRNGVAGGATALGSAGRHSDVDDAAVGREAGGEARQRGRKAERRLAGQVLMRMHKSYAWYGQSFPKGGSAASPPPGR